MKIVEIFRYPFKGLSGENLVKTDLKPKHGISGDRRFAFGIDASKDDGQWYSSRSYLINSICDNLLKYQVVQNQDSWVIISPSGQKLKVDPSDLTATNMHLPDFLAPVATGDQVPCLIDRDAKPDPKGHWDFRDSELLIVNLATLRDLEQTWGIKIDPRRFRANLLIDGLPAWSEFELYGAELSLGGAKVEILRPARRCAALSVSPTTGDRDISLQNMLVQDFGHGFCGVYARVSQQGQISIGDSMKQTATGVLDINEMACDGAPDVALWPKAVTVSVTDKPDVIRVSSVGYVPLLQSDAKGRMKVHFGAKSVVRGEIMDANGTSIDVKIDCNFDDLDMQTQSENTWKRRAYVTGPFGGQSANG